MLRRMRRAVIQGTVAAAILATAGCAEQAGSGSPAGRAARADDQGGGPEIGLRRGYAWATLTVRPPHIIGPNATMLLKDSVLSGAISGARMHVRINPDGADGYGPSGPVALNFTKGPASVEVNGTWNGYRVHLDFAEDSLRGTVVNSGDHSGTPEFRRPDFGPLAAPQDPGIVTYATCEYSLNEVGKDGALSGTSICGGMPEPTRLEVPRLVRVYMTRPELVVVLVALLSTPPIIASEMVGSPS